MQFIMHNWKNVVAAIAVAGLLVMGGTYVANAQAEDVTMPHEAIEAAIADALGLTVDELQDQLWAGRTLADLAEAAGVEIADLRTAADEAQQAQREAQIQAAVEAGDITQEQADWMLEGIAQGYMPGGYGWGGYGMHGYGMHGYGMHGYGMHSRGGFGGWFGGGLFGGDCPGGMGYGYGDSDGYGPGMGMYGRHGMMGRPFATPDTDSSGE